MSAPPGKSGGTSPLAIVEKTPLRIAGRGFVSLKASRFDRPASRSCGVAFRPLLRLPLIEPPPLREYSHAVRETLPRRSPGSERPLGSVRLLECAYAVSEAASGKASRD